jgi:hypothetical protein
MLVEISDTSTTYVPYSYNAASLKGIAYASLEFVRLPEDLSLLSKFIPLVHLFSMHLPVPQIDIQSDDTTSSESEEFSNNAEARFIFEVRDLDWMSQSANLMAIRPPLIQLEIP